MDDNLPPLPEPYSFSPLHIAPPPGNGGKGFTADQMREYAMAERKATIERCAALCADLEKKYWTSYRSIDGVDLDYDFVLGKADSVKECEAAIRALLGD